MKGHNVGRAGYAPSAAARWYHPLTLFGRSEGDSEEVALGLSRLCLLLPPGKSLRLVARNDDALGDGSTARLGAGVAAEHVARVRLLCDAGDLGEAAAAFADTLGLEECSPPEDDPAKSEGASWVRLADGRLCASVPLLRVPDVTRIGWLDRLVHLPFPCRVVVTVVGLSPVAEEARLRHAARKVAAAQGAIMAAGGQGEHLQLDAGAEHTAILTRVQDPATRVQLLGISVSVFASDHTTLQTRMRRIKEAVRTLGAQPATGLCDQLPLYLATTAGGPPLPRRHLYRALSPTVGTSWPGISHAPGHRSGDAIGVAVPGGELVRFDPFAEALTNSLINVVGVNGSGKCVDPDTWVWARGLRRFGEVWGDYEIQGPHGVGRVMGWYDDGERDGFRVTTAAGDVIDGTPDHRIWVRNSSGYEGWRRLGDLQSDDYVGMARSQAQWGLRDLPSDDAYLLGLVIADGCQVTSCGQDILVIDKHPRVLERVLPILERWRDEADRRRPLTRQPRRPLILHHKSPQHSLIRVTGIGLHQYLQEDYGLVVARSYEKTVPAAVLRGTRETVQAFLRGYFDGDGTCGPSVEASTGSPTLRDQVRMLLLGLGIATTTHCKQTARRPSYTIRVIDPVVFGRMVGFSPYGLTKDTRFSELLARTRNPNLDVVPGMAPLLQRIHPLLPVPGVWTERGVSAYGAGKVNPSYALLEAIEAALPPCAERDELSRIVRERRFWTPVARIEPSRIRRIDCIVDESHAFIGNGIINHNTFLVLQQAARTLRAGGRVTIIAAAGPYLSLGAMAPLCHVMLRRGEPLVVPDMGADVLYFDLSCIAGDDVRSLVPDLFSTVWQRATASERRDFLIVDEGWNLVLYGGAAEHVERIFRLGRQAGIYSAFLTQKLADLLRHPAAAAVYEQAASSFYFRQSDANLSALRDLEDLSSAEMAALPHLPRILHKSADAFLITKEAERTRRGVVRLWSTPEDRLLFGSYPEEARARAAAIARHGSLEKAVAAL